MKKQRHYFGKNKVKHRLGRVGGTWVVPRMLRLYFERKYEILNLEQAAKMNINANFGRLTTRATGLYGADLNADTGVQAVKELPSVADLQVSSRRELKQIYRSGSMPNMDRVMELQFSPGALMDVLSTVQCNLRGKIRNASYSGTTNVGLDPRAVAIREFLKAKWYYELAECYPQINLTLWEVAGRLVDQLPLDLQTRWQTDPRVLEMLANAEKAVYEGNVGKFNPLSVDPEKVLVVDGGEGTAGFLSTLRKMETTLHPALIGAATLPDWDNGPLFDKNGDAIPYTLTGPLPIVSGFGLDNGSTLKAPEDLVPVRAIPVSTSKSDWTVYLDKDGNLLDTHPREMDSKPSTPKVSFRGIRDTSSLPSEPEIVDAIRDAAYVALVNQTYEDVTGVQYPPVLGADFSFREVVVDETTGLCTAIVVDTAGNLGGEPGQEYLLKDGFVRAGGDGQEIDPSKPVELTFNYLSDSEELGKAIFEAIMGTTKPDWMVLVDKDGNPIPEDARWEDLPDDLRNAILTKMGAKPKE